MLISLIYKLASKPVTSTDNNTLSYKKREFKLYRVWPTQENEADFALRSTRGAIQSRQWCGILQNQATTC